MNEEAAKKEKGIYHQGAAPTGMHGSKEKVWQKSQGDGQLRRHVGDCGGLYVDEGLYMYGSFCESNAAPGVSGAGWYDSQSGALSKG
ncbi:hypothetical protein EXT50_22270 [Pectobacterium polaris]|uniref:Uncharacterized protein n=1 Tax=Pectobacterium polaris TaxID=2042057 RepID=A0ABT0QW91_9GAMM|nr:hypothetical protein [Pectobacterium polaris]